MSLATRAVWPVRRAARSPANACKSTASRARSPVLPPPERRARTAAAIPVRTSPAPAVAMPGLPWAQTAEVPSGSATILRAPLRTTREPRADRGRRLPAQGRTEGAEIAGAGRTASGKRNAHRLRNAGERCLQNFGPGGERDEPRPRAKGGENDERRRPRLAFRTR